MTYFGKKFLSPGGKTVLIQHILQSQPLHIFVALMPYASIIKNIEMHFSNFFWGNKDGKKKKFVIGLLGKTSYMIYICLSLSTKRWWRIGTEKYLWAEFLKAKYCQRRNPMSKVATLTDSSSWRELLSVRDKVEKTYLLETQLIRKMLPLGQDWDLDSLNPTIPRNVVNIVENIHIGD
ncbi:hypothetical protein H5410_015901 [Solanum commersonii]|uniref:Uncharacterized protein n=1 Tax=Solanum commersonii TaxID=4109 RepID=A0A9J5ZUS2_SOLCO|nr:hypothetical protein H5410_015901 [Solanum commersonii]